jgi:hypothetical protein
MLNKSLQLSQVERNLVSLSLHDNLFFEETLVFLVDDCALCLHLFYRFLMLSFLLNLVSFNKLLTLFDVSEELFQIEIVLDCPVDLIHLFV